jgi:acyl carrier protein
MDELSMSERLVSCFQAVFPHSPAEWIPVAEQGSEEAYDSVSSIMLFTVLEEEFGVNLDIERLSELTSFNAILAYLRTLLAATRREAA